MRAVGSGVERFLDTEEVTGSNPVLPIFSHAVPNQQEKMSFIDNLKTRVTPILFNRLDGKMHKTALPIAISATQKVRESGRVRARQRTAYSPQSISQPDAIAVETLKSALDSWITQGKLRRMSQATLTNRTFVIDKLLWHLERHQRKMCDRKALEDFLSYAGSPIPSNVARWGNTRTAGKN